MLCNCKTASYKVARNNSDCVFVVVPDHGILFLQLPEDDPAAGPTTRVLGGKRGPGRGRPLDDRSLGLICRDTEPQTGSGYLDEMAFSSEQQSWSKDAFLMRKHGFFFIPPVVCYAT